MQLQHFINGMNVETGTETRDIFNPATHQNIALMPIATEDEIESAIDCATHALTGWSKRPSEERAGFLVQIAEGLLSRKLSIARQISATMGKPINESLLDVDDAVACYYYYASVAKDFEQQSRVEPLDDSGFSTIRRYEAVGVVGLIVPWNFPTVTTAWKLAAALAAGCTVVLKPSEISPEPELVLADIFTEIGLPKGVVNIICGEARVGEYMVSSERFDKISFTGSTQVGQKIMVASAPSLKNLSLELGGKSSLIVCSSANVDQAAQLAANGIFFNNGQMCSATSRLLVHSSIYADVLKKLKEVVAGLRIGDPLSDNTDLGPLSSMLQFNKVTEYFALARKEQLACLIGGSALDGNYVEPTVYYDVPRQSRLWREEIFGPVLCVAPFDSIEGAIELANDSEYGLAASVVSNDPSEAISVANRLKAGSIWINTDQIVFPQLSWGGFGKSSIGRELGLSGLHAFTELKHIVMKNEDLVGA